MTLVPISKLAPYRKFLPIEALCLIFLLIVIGDTSAQVGHSGANSALIEKLRVGGYNIYVRHTATNWSQNDKIHAHGDWVSCDPRQVRQPSEQGRKDARELGAVFRKLGIQLGKVFSSPYCRTRETALLISGQNAESTTDMMNLRSVGFVGGREAVIERARKRLSKPPARGVNDLFVAHGNLGRAATGKSLAEGEVLIVNPHGNGEFNIEGTLNLIDIRVLSGP